MAIHHNQDPSAHHPMGPMRVSAPGVSAQDHAYDVMRGFDANPAEVLPARTVRAASVLNIEGEVVPVEAPSVPQQ